MRTRTLEAPILELSDQSFHIGESTYIIHPDGKVRGSRRRSRGASTNLTWRQDSPFQAATDRPALATALYAQAGTKITKAWLRQEIGRYEAIDDVFRGEFLAAVIFGNAKEDALTKPSRHYLTRKGTRQIYFLPLEQRVVLPGPYLLSSGYIRRVWKLQIDVNGVFLATFRTGNGL